LLCDIGMGGPFPIEGRKRIDGGEEGLFGEI